MRPILILLCFVAMAACAFASPAHAGCGPNGCMLTLEVPVEYEVQPASHPVAAATICTAGRSVACAAKIATLPVRLVKSVADKKPLRHAVAAIASHRPLRAIAVGGARLIWHRTACR